MKMAAFVDAMLVIFKEILKFKACLNYMSPCISEKFLKQISHTDVSLLLGHSPF